MHDIPAENASGSQPPAAPSSSPLPPYAQSFGYALAMGVLQSDLYRTLDDQQRAECDEFIARGQGRAAAPHPDLHAAILALPCKPYDGTDAYTHYCRGFEAARHAAAELAAAPNSPKEAPEFDPENWPSFAMSARLAAHLETPPQSTPLEYATSLANALWIKHYRTTAPDWKPLPDLLGLLTQIDNMAAGLALPKEAPQEVERDAARLDWLNAQCMAYGFENEHHGNRWTIEGPFRNLRIAIDAEMNASKAIPANSKEQPK